MSAQSPSGASYPSDWDQRRRRVYERDGWTCQHCGNQGGDYGDHELHAHHVVPKSRGGNHELSNLITLCGACHNAAHDHYIPHETPSARDGGSAQGDRNENALDESVESSAARESAQQINDLDEGAARDGSGDALDENNDAVDEDDSQLGYILFGLGAVTTVIGAVVLSPAPPLDALMGVGMIVLLLLGVSALEWLFFGSYLWGGEFLPGLDD